MKLYCEIEDNFGVRVIKRGPCPLPDSIDTVSGFSAITDLRTLKSYGWLPYNKITDNKPIVTGSNIVILDDVVQETFFTRDETLEEREEKAWYVIREKRNELLKESDILVLADRWENLSDEERGSISTYRQALRDLPQTYAFSYDVIWPVK